MNEKEASRVFEAEDYLFVFSGKDGKPILRFKNNGDIYVEDRLATNDTEIVEGLRKFLRDAKCIS